MVDELNIPLTVTDNTAGAFKSAANNLRNIEDVARRNNMSVEEWQKKGSQQQLSLSDREVKELKRNVQEHERAQEKKSHASKRAADAHVHHASLSRIASEQVVEVLTETAAKYLSVAAAVEGTREAFMGFAREDATLRRMSVTFNKTLHEVESLTPAWRETGKAVGASINEMVDGIDALGKASNKGLDVGDAAIKAMAKGHKALGITTREAGEIQGTFMRNMGVSGEEAIEVWQQLLAANKEYNLDLKALAPMLPSITADAERLGMKGTGGVATMVAMLGKLQSTGDAGGGLSRVLRELTSEKVGSMLGRTDPKRWALEIDNVRDRGDDVFSHVMGLWQKEREQNKALTAERVFGERNAKFIKALMKDSTIGADDLLRSMNRIYAAGKSGVILDEKVATMMAGPAAAAKKMGDEFEHMSVSFGQLIAVAGAPGFLEGAAKRFESIAKMIEYISKKAEGDTHHGPTEKITSKRRWGFSTITKAPDDPEHPDHSPPLLRWDPKTERGPLTKGFGKKMIRGGLGLDLFNAATATARIPGDAYKGKYQSHPVNPSTLTEEDAFRENQARDQEGRDALGLSAYGLGATGAARAGRFKRTRDAAKLSVPDFIPGGLRKKIGGEGEVPLAVPVEKIILPIASLDNNIERLTKEVAALKSVLETPRATPAVKFRSRVGGTAPWEERAYQRRIDSHVPGEAGPTSGMATGELLGALGGGSSGGGGRARGGGPAGGGGAPTGAGASRGPGGGGIGGAPSMGGGMGTGPTPRSGGADTEAAIADAAKEAGVPVSTMRAIASIESNMNPESNRGRSTQYKGLYQMGTSEWAQHGKGGDVYNARDNAMGAASLLKSHKQWFNKQYGRDPNDAELYMMHQQGRGFFSKGSLTNVAGNPYPGMRGPQTSQSFMAGWGAEIERRKQKLGDGTTAVAGGSEGSPGGIPAAGGAAARGAASMNNLNPEFRARLDAMYRDAPPEVQKQLNVQSGWRSTEVQAQLYAKSGGSGMVARPGHSQHEKGGAADLGGMGLQGSGSSPTARAWVHANAAKYGLKFPMSYEPWHVQPDHGFKGSFLEAKQPAAPAQEAREEQGPKQPEAMRGAVPGLEQYKQMREELEKPIPISFKHDRSMQFARASAAREHDREMRETRHNVNADIGAA